MSTLRIRFVIPIYYNFSSLYKVISKSLNSVYQLKGLKEIVIVDDASPLDPIPWWNVRVTNEKNLGFTATVNAGMRLEGKDWDVCIVMNDDITITQECFGRFNQLDPSRPIIASPADTSSSDDDRFGACWGITSEAYRLLGPLDERYRNFYSDVDYYERAKKAGVEIIKWNEIVLEHPESSTFNLLDKESLLESDRKVWERNV